MERTYRALGMMSGTSMDGIDAAVIETDGDREVRCLGGLTTPFDPEFRKILFAMQGRKTPMAEVETALTLGHAEAVEKLLEKLAMTPEQIDVIGFHGQTTFHAPNDRVTVQMGDGPLLAGKTGIPVVHDFRRADVEAGGEGAPFAPVYHAARAAGLEKPLLVVNLGGVGNLTYIGRDGDLMAFDTGPANAPIDDWVARHGAGDQDTDGALALAGKAERGRITHSLRNSFFRKPPPKSLDRSEFAWELVKGLSLEDGCATLARFAAETVVQGRAFLPEKPKRVLVSGGGRHNKAIMACLAERMQVPVEPCEAAGWDGGLLEAEAFAYMAVRHLLGEPISFPTTTGVRAPMVGGKLALPSGRQAPAA
ncbi:MAG: anhydro-N-acetylmuramic acid kinase [Alphaproteobacteria bacterium]|nr:anhydro-N-acetylmuramic acid kinase [Alphaproteobacteria bacterium]